MKIIITWDNKYDMDMVRGDDGSPIIFKSFRDAENWAEDNDSKLCSYMRIVSLEELRLLP